MLLILLLLLLLLRLLLPSGWILQNLTEFRLDHMHSLARFASNVELLLPVCPLQHGIRAAKSTEALPVVPEWSKGGQLRRDSKTWGHTREWASVLIYWSNFTGAPVVLLETSSTVCRCSAGHTGRHTGGREIERVRVGLCVRMSFWVPIQNQSEVFFSLECLAGQKRRRKSRAWNNKITDLNVGFFYLHPSKVIKLLPLPTWVIWPPGHLTNARCKKKSPNCYLRVLGMFTSWNGASKKW